MSETPSAETIKNPWFDKISQFLLPILTIVGFTLTSIKRPEYGLVFNLIAQIFWLYSGWVAWKKAGQIGIFITSLLISVIVIYGVINYWLI